MKAVLLGPPGAGKGTFANYFSRKYCIPHIATGDIFRAEIMKGTELGRIIKEYVDRGELVPDDIVIEIIKKRLSQPDTRNGFLLDGYPRTLPQAYALDKFTSIDVAIYIYIPLEVAIDRLSNRYVCPKCGAVYNLKYHPPKNDLRCDYDGEKLIRRSDDDPEVIKKRYEIYYKQSQPVIDYYREKGLLIEVDNSGDRNPNILLLEKTLIDRGILKLKPCRDTGF